MSRTNAEHQAAWRQRRADRLVVLERENGELRREMAAVKADLADALEENARLARPACRHPAEAIVDGRCLQCGQDVW